MQILIDSVGALTALLALGAAVWAGRTAKRVYDIESRRDRVAEWDRAAADAQLISAWCVAEADGERRGVVITNAGTNAVYEVSVSVDLPWEGNHRDITIQLLPPGKYVVTPQDGKYPWAFPVRIASDEGWNPIMNTDRWRVDSLRFRDAAGEVWMRGPSGRLAPTN